MPLSGADKMLVKGLYAMEPANEDEVSSEEDRANERKSQLTNALNAI